MVDHLLLQSQLSLSCCCMTSEISVHVVSLQFPFRSDYFTHRINKFFLYSLLSEYKMHIKVDNCMDMSLFLFLLWVRSKAFIYSLGRRTDTMDNSNELYSSSTFPINSFIDRHMIVVVGLCYERKFHSKWTVEGENREILDGWLKRFHF